MITHVVLFRPRADLSTADAAALVASLEAAARSIPAVRRFRVGKRVIDGPRYDSGAAADFPFLAIIELDDRDRLEAYLAHPAHAALGRAFGSGLAAALVVDYEVRDAGEGIGDFLLPADDRALPSSGSG